MLIILKWGKKLNNQKISREKTRRKDSDYLKLATKMIQFPIFTHNANIWKTMFFSNFIIDQTMSRSNFDNP